MMDDNGLGFGLTVLGIGLIGLGIAAIINKNDDHMLEDDMFDDEYENLRRAVISKNPLL